ncbi:MAG: histidine kinase [Serpentinimonas sp.]|jgi:transcriptional regulator of acetoin/glycerol metabolism|nr:histidine kinase [Serpentinimonas sp.]
MSQPAPLNTRQQQIESARQSYLERGPAAVGAWHLPLLNRSWQRCLERGFLPRDRVAFAEVSAGARAEALQGSQQLLVAARPVIRSLARAMAQTRYFAVLTNHRGIVVDVHGPVDTQDPRATALARIGVDLSEAAVGTTAIGLALTDEEAVWLHQGEHFFDVNTAYSCAGAPVYGPHGELVGMLDLTGIDVLERPALKHLVVQSVGSVNNALVLAQPHHLLLRLNWPGLSLGSDADGLVCTDREGYIVAANRHAIDMLGLAPGWVALHCSEVFASAWESLYDLARTTTRQSELPLWSGLRLQVMALAASDATAGVGSTGLAGKGSGLPLKDLETSLIRKAVQDAGGNVAEAARALGISRATVYRKLERR